VRRCACRLSTVRRLAANLTELEPTLCAPCAHLDLPTQIA
jgi:hypothetical protein